MTEPIPDPAKPTGNLPDEVTQVLKDIREHLTPPEQPPAPTVPPAAPQVDREALKKTLGYSEEQLQAHEALIARQQAPATEALGWARLEKKQDIDTFRKEIEAELALYPVERRTPEIMEKIYYFAKGKRSDSKPAQPSPTSTPPAGSRVADTRVSRGPGYSGADAGLPSGGSGEGAPDAELNDLEKFVSDKLGVNHKDYQNAKKAGKEIRSLRVPDTRAPTSLADVELRRMQGNR